MSWASVKVQGIILSVHKFREADRRYCALTDEQGKIVFVGRGAQKKLAKLASHLEPFAIVDLEIIRGRRSVTVISVERKKWFRGIADSLEARLLASASLQLLDRYTYEGEEDAQLYGELQTWLEFLNEGHTFLPGRSTFLLGGFLLRCLTHLGYSTELSTCVHCKSAIKQRQYKWDARSGGLVCSDCIRRQPQDWFRAREMHEDVVKLLRFARSQTYQELLKVHLRGEHIEEYAQVVQDLLFHHLPHRNEIPFWSGIMIDYTLDLPRNQM